MSKQYSCLIVQKDTLENEKVKSVLKVVSEDPTEYLNKLQDSHCIPFQLLAYTECCSQLSIDLTKIVADHKTSYGTDWYEFNHNVLAQIISAYLTFSKTVIDLHCISDIIGFKLNMFPVVKKEIKIETIDTPVVQSGVDGPDLKIPELISPVKIDAIPLSKKEEILEEIEKTMDKVEKIEKDAKASKVSHSESRRHGRKDKFREDRNKEVRKDKRDRERKERK